MPDYRPKVKEIIEFVFSNRKDLVFKGTEKEVTTKICNGITDGNLYYTVSDNKVTGVILIEHLPNDKVLYIREILCLTKQSLKQFIEAFNELFPSYRLEASRNNHLVSYTKTNRLCQLLKRIK